MVISSTSAVEASIQAVSPELIFAPSTSSGFVGAGGAAGAAAGAPAAGAAAGAAAGGAGGAGGGARAPRLFLGPNRRPPPPPPRQGKNCRKIFSPDFPQSAHPRVPRARAR